MMLSKIYFLLGGARSGKSEYAESLASSLSDKVLYFATAKIIDEEMKKRVQLHKSRRPKTWKTIEINKDVILFDDIKKIIEQAVMQKYEVLVVDCITNLLFRLVYEYELDNLEVIENKLEKKIEKETMMFFNKFFRLMCRACGKISEEFSGDNRKSIIDSMQTSSDIRQASADARRNFEESIIVSADEKSNLNVILVSNEVGLGLVPSYPFGRIFRDLLGLINKKITLVSDEIYFFVAGLKLKMK